MAATLLSYVVSDLCLGKPPLKSLPVTATVAAALSALKTAEETSLSVWSCSTDHSATDTADNYQKCHCVGKISIVDVICFLCREENLKSPSSALNSPVSAVLSKDSARLVIHLDPSASLLDAIDQILQGAQNLVVPIQTTNGGPFSQKKTQKTTTGPTFHGGRQYCWLTEEDIIRFILSRIGLFTPIANLSIETLGIINTDFSTIDYHAPAYKALDGISRSLVEQTSVAVVDEDGCLVGEISPFTLAYCDEIVAAAIMALSAGDLMAYIDWGKPPADIVKAIRMRLREKKLGGLLEMVEDEYLTSDDELSLPSSSPKTPLARSGRYNRSGSYSARMVRQAEAIVCHPGSSLVAVMVQAIAHRVSYVWVIEDDCTLIGIVTFHDMLDVLSEHLQSVDQD